MSRARDLAAFVSNADGDIKFDTDTLFIDSSANKVGIGTNSPNRALSLEDGDIQIHDTGTSGDPLINFSVGNTQASPTQSWSMRIDNSDSDKFQLLDVTDSRIVLTADGSGNVGIGESSPSLGGSANGLHITGASGNDGVLKLDSSDATHSGKIQFTENGTDQWRIAYDPSNNHLEFTESGLADRMVIADGGDVRIGTTTARPDNYNGSGSGTEISGAGILRMARNGDIVLLNRISTDGSIVEFRKNGTTVGTIGVSGQGKLYIGKSDIGLTFQDTSGVKTIHPFNTSNLGGSDGLTSLGFSNNRFANIHATNGTIQTSDENEKQQIASLTDAEMTAAKAISKLFKTFKWNNKVEVEGDAARIHTGVIAQQVQTAMSDAGLDASKYAFWCSDTWWEKDIEVAAVEAVEAKDAVYDDDGKLVSEAVEAVEAKDAYTRTDQYYTKEEAPEGATERTRLGVRYPELLAFVGAATEQRLTSIEARLDALEAE